ncbi:MAG TPA: DUF4910 domain-containing protein [Candidatus Polarisedimenticolaceae bacterium]|nr:DUF4910 domain-containing protein [Candidatus Polarisedimenticolaceae bacterium]
MRASCLAAAALLAISARAVERAHLVPQSQFDAIASEYSGEAAQENTRQIVQYHRIQGSPMMEAVASDVVLPKLKALGLEASIEQFDSDGATRYQTWISPMGWDMRGGELWVESVAGDDTFVPYRLCRYSDVPMCVSTYSKGGSFQGELVDVGAGTSDRDYEGKTVAGKVVLATGYAAEVVRQAVIKRGAAGAVVYPDALDRPDHPDMVRYNGLWTRAGEIGKTSGSFQISATQVARLHELMAHGAVRVRGTIDATLGRGKLTLVHAYVRGTDAREVLITAHLDHPKWSANDNASGSGAMIEVARTVQALVAAKKLTLSSTLHFMWVPEFYGTMAYVTKHPEAKAPHIVANLNMDMVGEDTVKTNSRFYFTRTPDSVPSFLNALLEDVLDQTKGAALVAPTGSRHTWPAEEAPYMQGSDHDVFLALGVPSTMLGHDPDWTHHTSEDTIDKTDATEFKRVGVFAAAAAAFLASAGDDAWKRLGTLAVAEQVADFTRRAGRASAFGDGACVPRYRAALGALTSTSGPVPIVPGTGHGAHPLAIQPFEGSAFEPLAGADLAWWKDQEKRFGAGGPGRDLVVYEAVNFMNGRRTSAEIAESLSCEFDTTVDAAWVDRLIAVLGKLKLVAS